MFHSHFTLLKILMPRFPYLTMIDKYNDTALSQYYTSKSTCPFILSEEMKVRQDKKK